jgi:hypothetical protein
MHLMPYLYVNLLVVVVYHVLSPIASVNVSLLQQHLWPS